MSSAAGKKRASPLRLGWRFLILSMTDDQLAEIQDPVLRNLATVARDQHVLGAIDEIKVQSDDAFNRRGVSSVMKIYYYVTFGIEDLDMALAWSESEVEEVTGEMKMNEEGQKRIEIPIMSDDGPIGLYSLSETTKRSFSHIEGMIRHVEETAVPDYPDFSMTREHDDIIGTISLGSHNPRVEGMLKRGKQWKDK